MGKLLAFLKWHTLLRKKNLDETKMLHVIQTASYFEFMMQVMIITISFLAKLYPTCPFYFFLLLLSLRREYEKVQ